MLRHTHLVWLLTSILLYHSLSQAQFYTGPIATAMGGAGRAGNNPSESSYLNPASVAELKNYYGAMSAAWGDHPIDGSFSEFSALLADGTPDKVVPGEFSYVQKRVSEPSGFTTNLQDFQLGVAQAPFESLAFGLSVHRLIYQDNQNRSSSQNNLNFGTLYAPQKQLTFAFVAYDILGGDDSVPQSYQTVPTMAVAAEYKFEASFDFCLDFVRPDKFNQDHRVNTQVGIETYFTSDFVARAGWQWREVGFEEKLFSLGFGYKGPRLSFDYAFQKDVLAGAGSRHFVDMWLHF